MIDAKLWESFYKHYRRKHPWLADKTLTELPKAASSAPFTHPNADVSGLPIRQVENGLAEAVTKPPAKASRSPKQSTVKGEAQVKLIAALTQHHGYENGSCAVFEPIPSNELARQAKVSKSTASEFFKKEFHGHQAYKNACMNTTRLVSMLKALNNEFRPHNFLGRIPDENERDE